MRLVMKAGLRMAVQGKSVVERMESSIEVTRAGSS